MPRVPDDPHRGGQEAWRERCQALLCEGVSIAIASSQAAKADSGVSME